MKFVTPEVFFVGETAANLDEIRRYLTYSGQEEFNRDIDEALAGGMKASEIMVSLFAKLCYKSLVKGKNPNVTKTRAIVDNFTGCFDQGHGAIFEHVGFNFLVTDCSRVFTHEQVRHRLAAYSQTSGRYCRPAADEQARLHIDFVHDPILDPVKPVIERALRNLLDEYRLCLRLMGLEGEKACAEALCDATAILNPVPADPAVAEFTNAVPSVAYVAFLQKLAQHRVAAVQNFDAKKKMTSALRRILPNGQANEIAVTLNIRALRHCVQVRTSRFAEWEIRKVYARIFELVGARYPLIFHGAKTETVDGLPEVYGMKMQPYDRLVEDLPTVEMLDEIRRRDFQFADKAELEKLRTALSSRLNELERTG